MEKTISIEISDLAFLHSQLDSETERLNIYLSQLELQINKLLQCWSGEARNAFAGNFENNIAQLREVTEMYKSYCKTIKTAISEYGRDSEEAINIISSI